MELHKTPERTKSGFVLLDQNMRLVKPVNEYLDFQALRGRAENTLLAYGKDLKTFFEFLEQRKLQYDQVTANMIRDYVEYLRAPDVNTVYLFVESKRSPATINRMISTLHGFYGYHVSMYGIVNPVITEDINSPNGIFRGILYHTRKSNYTRQSVFKVKESEYRIHLFTTTEMRQMHDVLPTARDKLLFKFLLQSGARISEALSLRIEDIPVPDISSDISVLRHVKSKGRYQRCANRKQIETICLNYLRGLEATKLSVNGHMYFVPRTHMDQVDIFEDFITLLSGLNKRTTPLIVNSFYIIDDAKQREKMTEEFYNAVKKEIAVYQEKCDYLIKSNSQSPAIMDRWILKVQALEEKKRHYEGVLQRELDGLDDEFSVLKLLSQELQVRANGIRNLRFRQKAA